MIFHGNYFKLNTATEHWLLYMAERTKQIEKKWLSLRKTAILSYNYTFQKAEIDILAQKKTHLLL
jgi:Holliday junction resolvase-like predicted endonuclease